VHLIPKLTIFSIVLSDKFSLVFNNYVCQNYKITLLAHKVCSLMNFQGGFFSKEHRFAIQTVSNIQPTTFIFSQNTGAQSQVIDIF